MTITMTHRQRVAETARSTWEWGQHVVSWRALFEADRLRLQRHASRLGCAGRSVHMHASDHRHLDISAVGNEPEKMVNGTR